MKNLLKPFPAACVILSSSLVLSCNKSNLNEVDGVSEVASKEDKPNHSDPEGEQAIAEAREPSKSDSHESERDLIARVLLQRAEASRAVVFGVALREGASADRAKAWIALTQTESWMPLSDEQCEFALDLLKRYESGTELEKLVFWRLVFLRYYEQGASATGRIVGSDGTKREELRVMLLETLYSGLGNDSRELSEPVAAKRAVALLEEAVREAK
jgi:hypothetical protein